MSTVTAEFKMAILEHGRACIDDASLVFVRTGRDRFEVQLLNKDGVVLMTHGSVELKVKDRLTITPVGELFKLNLV
jgi:riboflavin synthase alpha subunit